MRAVLICYLLGCLMSVVLGDNIPCNMIMNPSPDTCRESCFCGFCYQTEKFSLSDNMMRNESSEVNGELKIPMCCYGNTNGPDDGCGCGNDTWVWTKQMTKRDKMCWSQLYLIDALFGLLGGFLVIVVVVTSLYVSEVYCIRERERHFLEV